MKLKMTLKSAKNILRARGMTINSPKHDGEYRVNFSGGSESMAYYTDDIDDAVKTGVEMADARATQREATLKNAFAKQGIAAPKGTKPLMSHSEEFALRTDLRAVEQKLFTLRYAVLDYTVGNVEEALAKVANVRAQLDELEHNLRAQCNVIVEPAGGQCPPRTVKHSMAEATEASTYALPAKREEISR